MFSLGTSTTEQAPASTLFTNSSMNVVCHVTGDLHVLQCYYNNHECVFISLINTDYQSLSSLEGNPKQVVKQLPAQPQYASSSRAVLSEKMMRVSSTIQITLFS